MQESAGVQQSGQTVEADLKKENADELKHEATVLVAISAGIQKQKRIHKTS
jgi:hypothetical protein